jgi:glycerol-3-phosphate dehydrogenase
LTKEDVLRFAPYLKEPMVEQEMPEAFLYYDAQMLDDAITRVAAHAACKLGGTYEEHTQAISVEKLQHKQGYRVVLETKNAQGETTQKTLTTRFLINASGAWSNANLLQWGITPGLTCLLNLGTHMVFNKNVLPQVEPDDCAATLIQAHDKRVVFFIPWFGRWLLGTTESILEGTPNHLTPPAHDREYLMTVARDVLNLTTPENHVDEVFCGVRCMPLKAKRKKTLEMTAEEQASPFSSKFYVKHLDKNISSLSRETVLDETHKGLISIYGGKYTTYRSTAKKLGLRISAELDVGGPSQTHDAGAWFLKELHEEHPEIFESSQSLRQL